MPFNIPTVTTNDISFGPGRLFLGLAGTTPTIDVGAITEDGLSVEVNSEKRDIRQGNPLTTEYSFSTAQSVKVTVTGIEWDFDNFIRALGAGVTATGPGGSTFNFGGDPLVQSVSLQVQHYMAQSGNTMNINVWKANGRAALAIGLGMEEHNFPMEFAAMRSATNWSGASLPATQQLIQFQRQS
jgi:hypothetical protein